MATSVRLKRLAKLALQHASRVVLYELSDPRLTLVTLTRCELTPDLSYATIHWSVLGSEADRTKVGRALAAASAVVQSAIGGAIRTRRTPRVRWKFDESIQGSMRVGSLLDDLKAERLARGDEEELPEEPPEDGDV